MLLSIRSQSVYRSDRRWARPAALSPSPQAATCGEGHTPKRAPYNARSYGNRIKKTEAGETTLYVNQYYDKNLTTSEVTTHYFLGGKEIAFRKGITLEYLHTDSLGSTSVTTDNSGAQVGKVAYFPFGGVRSTIGALDTEKLFTGQRLDDTGLYFYNARYYDATIGRFISPDTVVPNPANPQSLNRYSYCLNNPLRYTDPSGHAFWTPKPQPVTVRVDPPPPPGNSGTASGGSKSGGSSSGTGSGGSKSGGTGPVLGAGSGGPKSGNTGTGSGGAKPGGSGSGSVTSTSPASTPQLPVTSTPSTSTPVVYDPTPTAPPQNPNNFSAGEAAVIVSELGTGIFIITYTQPFATIPELKLNPVGLLVSVLNNCGWALAQDGVYRVSRGEHGEQIPGNLEGIWENVLDPTSFGFGPWSASPYSVGKAVWNYIR